MVRFLSIIIIIAGIGGGIYYLLSMEIFSSVKESAPSRELESLTLSESPLSVHPTKISTSNESEKRKKLCVIMIEIWSQIYEFNC